MQWRSSNFVLLLLSTLCTLAESPSPNHDHVELSSHLKLPRGMLMFLESGVDEANITWKLTDDKEWKVLNIKRPESVPQKYISVVDFTFDSSTDSLFVVNSPRFPPDGINYANSQGVWKINLYTGEVEVDLVYRQDCQLVQGVRIPHSGILVDWDEFYESISILDVNSAELDHTTIISYHQNKLVPFSIAVSISLGLIFFLDSSRGTDAPRYLYGTDYAGAEVHCLGILGVGEKIVSFDDVTKSLYTCAHDPLKTRFQLRKYMDVQHGSCVELPAFTTESFVDSCEVLASRVSAFGDFVFSLHKNQLSLLVRQDTGDYHVVDKFLLPSDVAYRTQVLFVPISFGAVPRIDNDPCRTMLCDGVCVTVGVTVPRKPICLCANNKKAIIANDGSFECVLRGVEDEGLMIVSNSVAGTAMVHWPGIPSGMIHPRRGFKLLLPGVNLTSFNSIWDDKTVYLSLSGRLYGVTVGRVEHSAIYNTTNVMSFGTFAKHSSIDPFNRNFCWIEETTHRIMMQPMVAKENTYLRIVGSHRRQPFYQRVVASNLTDTASDLQFDYALGRVFWVEIVVTTATVLVRVANVVGRDTEPYTIGRFEIAGTGNNHTANGLGLTFAALALDMEKKQLFLFHVRNLVLYTIQYDASQSVRIKAQNIQKWRRLQFTNVSGFVYSRSPVDHSAGLIVALRDKSFIFSVLFRVEELKSGDCTLYPLLKGNPYVVSKLHYYGPPALPAGVTPEDLTCGGDEPCPGFCASVNHTAGCYCYNGELFNIRCLYNWMT